MVDYKYDAAISCLKEDVRTAQELHDLLRPRVGSIFFYPEKQEQLIGGDGLAKFSAPFRTEARVVIVIYREGWGQTDWTKVEENAIEEMCLHGGWGRILVHSMDGTAPIWLPPIYIWSGAAFGLKALAAAVEQKIKEAGGQIGEEDIIATAQRVHRSLAAAEAREHRRESEEGVMASRREREIISARLVDLISTPEVSQNQLQGKVIDGRYTIWTSEIAAFFRWTGNTVNSIQGDKLILCGGSLGRYRMADDLVTWKEYELELAEDDATWRWVDGEDRHYSSAEVADTAIRLLWAEHDRRRRDALHRRRTRARSHDY